MLVCARAPARGPKKKGELLGKKRATRKKIFYSLRTRRARGTAARVWRTRLAARPEDDDIRDPAACIAVCDPWTSDTVDGVPLPGTSFYDAAWYDACGRLPDGRVFFADHYGFVCQNGARSEWRYVHGNVLSAALTGDTTNFAHKGIFYL